MIRCCVIALAITGCAPALGAVALGSVACDYANTRRAAQHGWMERAEYNTAISEAAGAPAVDAWFGTVAIGGAGLIANLPPFWRKVAYVAIAAVEIQIDIKGATGHDGAVCGVGR
jgi:hypothetical protein